MGVLVAERTLSEEIYKAQNDIPPGAKTNFWGNPWDVTPYKTGVIRTNETDYQYWLYAETLTDVVTGLPLGGATNRVKKVDIVVSWWGAQGGSRGGYGQLRYVANRLINEAP